VRAIHLTHGRREVCTIRAAHADLLSDWHELPG
jgi:hypothetical protein